ncbi:ribosomal protein S18-alanine N-acetyltransferase [Leuconostocaceae bacterium ESL0958]|nr:ribosomal protein S18-alanine N-acetyltransferase [Leuconostocaceae bacterium ESL0958]
MFLKFKKKKRQRPVKQLLTFPSEQFQAQAGASLRLRSGSVTDIPGLIAIQEAVYDGYSPWLFRDFEHELTQESDRLYLVVERHNQVVAFMALVRREAIADLHIANLAVLPVWQNQGIGTYLLHTASAIGRELQLTTISLEARRSNTGALALYDRLGYRVEDVLAKYYVDNGEDAIAMVLALDR